MEERRQSIILLVEGDRHHVNACHLDKRGFRPLVSAFEWECAIDVAPAGLFVSQDLHKAARSALIEGISDSFYDAVKNEGLRRLNLKKTQLVTEANAEADRMKTLNRQLVAMRDSAKQLTLLTTRVHAEFSHLAPEVHSLSQLVLNTGGRVRQMAELADALSNSARELHAAEGKLSTLRDEIKRITLETRTGKLR
jgi:methyl-accepting chemotaxis protein